MKTPVELAANPLDSHVEHNRRALSLTRLASGIRGVVSGPYCLNQLETESLLDAMLVLQDLSAANQKAAELARKRRAS